MTILQSAAEFSNVVPETCDFLKALTNTFTNFSFAPSNIQ